jgi:hypothetical protein
MSKEEGPMRFKVILMCVLLTFAVSATTTAAKDRKKKTADCTKHPGYVDFDALEIFGGDEAKIEVYLRQPMLELVAKFLKNEDPELYDMLMKLCLVRVQVFDVDGDLAGRFESKSSATVKALDKKGWERVVRVREDDESVFVYLKPSEDYEWIQGVVVLALEDYEEAVFVNIVGDIRPEDVHRLGEHFDVEELDSIRYEVKKKGN